MTVVQAGPAGWYPDPERLGGQRYWDGQVWTEQRSQASPTVVAGPTGSGGSSGVVTKLLLVVLLVLAGIVVVGILAAIAIPVFLNQRHQAAQVSYSATVASQTKTGMASLPSAKQDQVCTLFQRNADAVVTKIATTDLRLAQANAPTAYADMVAAMGRTRLLEETKYGVTRGMNEFCASH